MKKNCSTFFRLLTLFLLIIVTNYSYGGSCDYVSVLGSTSLISGSSAFINSADPSFASIYGITGNDTKYNTIVNLKYGRQDHSDVNVTGTILVTYRLEKRSSSGIITSLASSQTIKLDLASGVYESSNVYDGSTYEGEGNVYLVVEGVTKTGFTSGAFNPNDIQLELKLKKKWYKNLSSLGTPTIATRSESPELMLYWSYVLGAEQYELEYVFIDEQDNNYSSITTSNAFDHPVLSGSAVEGMHYKEPISLDLSDAYYRLYMNFPKGKVFYRVRAKSYLFSSSLVHSDAMSTGSWSAVGSYTQTSGYQADVVWQTVNTFAEEGKHKIVQSYMDGSSRGRQTQTFISSNRQTVVAENKYDYEGRPVVQILPAPLVGVDLGYKTLFNKAADGSSFEKNKFDIDYTSAPSLLTSSGAAKYYSSSNDVPGINTGYIPDANGYVYTQVRYTRDGTGRPAFQSGIGDMHTLHSEHETQYIYGTTNNTELGRLFGTNVGVSVHYKKNLVVDANGQVSVAYLDQEGRTIATALAGDSPDNLQALDENQVYPITATLMGNNIVDKANRTSEAISQITNVIPGTTYTFSYDMTGVINKLGEPFNICQSCRYHLRISIDDPDNLPVNMSVSGGGTTTLIEAECRKTGTIDCVSDVSFTGTTLTFTATFAKMGVYTVDKLLYMTDGDLTAMLEELKQADNFPDSTEIFNNYLNLVDSNLCEYTCKGVYQSPCEIHFRSIISGWESMSGSDQNYWLDRCTDSACAYLTSYGIDNAEVNECESYLNQMKASIRPARGGGYQYVWWDASTFTPGTTAITIDGSSYVPSAAALQDPDLFNEEWIDSLVQFHREYCHYVRCQDLRPSDQFDDKLSVIQTFDQATDPSLNALGIDAENLFGGTTGSITADAFFTGASSSSHPRFVYYVSMLARVQNYLGTSAGTTPGTALSIWEFYDPTRGATDVTSPVSATINVASTFYAGMTDPDEINDRRWRLMLGAYLAIKREVVDDWYTSIATTPHCSYINDVNAIVKPSSANLPGAAADVDPFISDLTSTHFTDVCAGNLTAWKLILLENCSALTSANFDAHIAPHLTNYCVHHAGISNPFGLLIESDVSVDADLIAAESYLAGLSPSCDLSSITESSPYSTATSGGTPVTYSYTHVHPCIVSMFDYLNRTSYWRANHDDTYPLSSTSDMLASCFFGKVSDIEHYDKNNSSGDYKNFVKLEFVATCTPQEIVISDEDGILFSNIQSVTNLRYEPTVPAYDCGGITVTPTTGHHAYSDGTTTRYYTKVTVDVRLHGDPLVYKGWLYATTTCYGTTCSAPVFDSCQCSVPFLIDDIDTAIIPDSSSSVWGPNTVTLPNYRDTCYLDLIAQVEAIAALDYHAQVEAFYEQLTGYMNKCFDDPFNEHFTVTYDLQEYHYTLYYYDQAGLLIQTVPPEGVDILPPASFSGGVLIATHEPNHRLKTNYKYNSLNAVRHQTTPDADSTLFCYNNKGQLKVSQNAKQHAANDYSYTNYDKLGRIEEVGETHTQYTPDLSREALTANTWYNLSLYPYCLTDKKEITYTIYSKAIVTGVAFDQSNLRGRVSMVYKAPTFADLLDAEVSGTAATNVATSRYSYDIHGNVSSLEQLNYDLEAKTTDYQYDLISGKVNKVIYQKDADDQFIHRYEYDADNRLTNVYTSTDDISWVEDGRYFYYPHGPLARTELGNQNLQGLDYSYTLHGWLKSVNIPLATGNNLATLDIGQDAISTHMNKYMAKDAMAFGLGYYQGDYAPIAGGGLGGVASSKWIDHGSMIKQASGGSAIKGLFNGNITFMATSIAPELLVTGSHPFSGNPSQTMIYQYDQLNRIKETKSNGDGGSWFNNDYREEFAYDMNGNIKTLKRYDEAHTVMDDMKYTYDYEGSQDGFTGTAPYWLESNRLYHVWDNIDKSSSPDYLNTSTANTADASVETANNFQYDLIGNLTKDNIENINEIKWNVYGKITSIDKTGSLDDLEYRYDAMGNRVMKIVKPAGSTVEANWDKTYYVRDASGNVMATYIKNHAWDIADQDIEYPIYGSSRLGIFTKEHGYTTNAVGNSFVDYGEKQYELSNHLGNVLVTISDNRIGVDANSDEVAEEYTADISTANDYYAFGSLMPGRQYNSGNYRYGFNGKEKDDEVKGSGNQLAFEARIYDSRLGRWLSTDPREAEYAWQSPYAYFANSPIAIIDQLGMGGDPTQKKESPSESSASIEEEFCRPPIECTPQEHNLMHELDPVNVTGHKEGLLKKIGNFFKKLLPVFIGSSSTDGINPNRQKVDADDIQGRKKKIVDIAWLLDLTHIDLKTKGGHAEPPESDAAAEDLIELFKVDIEEGIKIISSEDISTKPVSMKTPDSATVDHQEKGVWREPIDQKATDNSNPPHYITKGVKFGRKVK